MSSVRVTGFIAIMSVLVGGCGSYRIEYHTRPSYYKNAMTGATQDRVTLADGTVLVFTSRAVFDDAGDNSDGIGDGPSERFQIRQEFDDGTIVLRAFLPQHVLANTMTCLRNQEYELIWEQLLSEQTRRSYKAREQDYDDFAAFFAANRLELAATLTRLMLGLTRGESFMSNDGSGVVRFYFHPRIGREFDFKTVEVVAEGGGLKLLMIK